MDQAFLQSLGANNQAKSRVGMAPTDPYMPAFLASLTSLIHINQIKNQHSELLNQWQPN